MYSLCVPYQNDSRCHSNLLDLCLEIGMGFSKSLAAVASAELEAVWLRINIAPKTLSAPVEVDLHVHLSEPSGKFLSDAIENSSRASNLS
jgi:hypothetical protein